MSEFIALDMIPIGAKRALSESKILQNRCLDPYTTVPSSLRVQKYVSFALSERQNYSTFCVVTEDMLDRRQTASH